MYRAMLVLVCLLPTVSHANAADPLPRFTEEREAAALHFIRKHCPELLPLLDELKKTNRPIYELQVRETFHITELLADLLDDQKRYDLELKLWKTENKALVIVAKLTLLKDDDRKMFEDQLLGLAKELVDVEMQLLEYRVELLQSELSSTKEELSKLADNVEQATKERFEALLERSRKKRP